MCFKVIFHHRNKTCFHHGPVNIFSRALWGCLWVRSVWAFRWMQLVWRQSRKRNDSLTSRPWEMLSASVQGAGTLCIIFFFHLFLLLLHRTNSDSALHTSAMNPNPQDPFGMNQQMGRGPPQRNGESNTHTQSHNHNPRCSSSLFVCKCVVHSVVTSLWRHVRLDVLLYYSYTI